MLPNLRLVNFASVMKQINGHTGLSWFEYITVEPAMFFYMVGNHMTAVTEQELLVRKACLVNHNLTAEICDNLPNYAKFQTEIQV